MALTRERMKTTPRVILLLKQASSTTRRRQNSGPEDGHNSKSEILDYKKFVQPAIEPKNKRKKTLHWILTNCQTKKFTKEPGPSLKY